MRIRTGSAAVGAEAGEEVVGGFGQEAGRNGHGWRLGAGETVCAAACAAMEMHVHVVAAVPVRGGTGFIFSRACAVVDDMHKAFLHEEGKCAGDRRAVDGVECLFYLKRRQGAHRVIEDAEHKSAHGRRTDAVIFYSLFDIV